MFGVTTDHLALLLIGAMNLLTLYYTRKTEKNTNSMKDELVRSTGARAHAAGKEEGRLEGEAKAATLAEGVVLGKASTEGMK